MSDSQDKSSELDPGRERLALLALSMGAFVMALNANVLGALLPFLREGFDLEEREGYLLGAAGLAGAVGALILGPLADKLGRKPPILWGSFLFFLGSLAHAFADSYSALITSRAVAGFAGGVVYSSASAAVADLVPYRRRAAAMGFFSAGMFLSLPVGLPLAVLLSRWGWWQGIYVLQGALTLLSMLAIWKTLPSGIGRGDAWLKNLPRLSTPEVLGALLSVLLYVGAFFTAVQFMCTWLDEAQIVAKEDQWLVWLVLGFCSAVGSFYLARNADRLGKRNWVLATTLAIALCLVLLSLFEGLLGLLILGIPLAVVSASRTGPFQALISELVPADTRGTLMGLRSAAVNLGTGTMPMLAGSVYVDHGFGGLLYVTAGGVFLAFLLVLVLVKKR